MTSSMRRWMSLAKRFLISWVVMAVFPSKDLWAIVVLGGEHAHEAEPSRAIEISWIKKDRRYGDSSLQLLEQRESPIYGKQSASAENENDVAKRIRFVWHA